MKRVFWGILGLMFLVAGTAFSGADVTENDRPMFSVSPYLGGAFWSEDLGLEDKSIFGVRGAYHFLNQLSLEATYGYSDPGRFSDGADVPMTHLGADLVYDLLPTSKINPYILVGWAQFDYDRPGEDDPHIFQGFEGGAGLKIRLLGNNATHTNLRLDVRDFISDLTPGFANSERYVHNVIATVGIQLTFGFSSKDDDSDGVANRDDQCSGTPVGATVDDYGCCSDSDDDGVVDGVDKCNETPTGARVDARGCCSDGDGDGVVDGLDKCEETPAGFPVDANGCCLDSDADGVVDGADRCADTPAGVKVDEFGCLVAEIVKADLVLKGVTFESSKAVLIGSSFVVLDEVAASLLAWPEENIEIQGHTDSSGSAEFNQKISQERADAVRDYLISKGVPASQVTSVGYGEDKPIADNTSSAGKAANRRVVLLRK